MMMMMMRAMLMFWRLVREVYAKSLPSHSLTDCFDCLICTNLKNLKNSALTKFSIASLKVCSLRYKCRFLFVHKSFLTANRADWEREQNVFPDSFGRQIPLNMSLDVGGSVETCRLKEGHSSLRACFDAGNSVIQKILYSGCLLSLLISRHISSSNRLRNLRRKYVCES